MFFQSTSTEIVEDLDYSIQFDHQPRLDAITKKWVATLRNGDYYSSSSSSPSISSSQRGSINPSRAISKMASRVTSKLPSSVSSRISSKPSSKTASRTSTVANSLFGSTTNSSATASGQTTPRNENSTSRRSSYNPSDKLVLIKKRSQRLRDFVETRENNNPEFTPEEINKQINIKLDEYKKSDQFFEEENREIMDRQTRIDLLKKKFKAKQNDKKPVEVQTNETSAEIRRLRMEKIREKIRLTKKQF